MKTDTKKLAVSGLMCAFAYIAMLVSKLIPEVAGFLQFDLKDVVIVMGGFILGPMYSLIISVTVPILELISASNTGIIGMLMNIISTVAFCCTASLIYYKFRSFKGALAGLFFGTAMLAVAMLLWNYYITPVYMKVPRSVVISMLPTVFLPFNVIKGLINSAFTLILYRPVTKGLSKARLLKSQSAEKKASAFLPSIVLGLLILAICIPAVIYFFG